MARESAPSRRTLTVLALLLGSMTFASALLLALEPGPRASLAGVSLSATEPRVDPVAILFETADQVAPAAWSAIAIQFSGSSYGSAVSVHEDHKQLGLDSLAYHFVIGNGRGSDDGQIEISHRWRLQQAGAQVGSLRGPTFQRGVIQVCLIGDFNRNTPTEAQMRELVWLVRQLQGKHNIPAESVYLSQDMTGAASRLFPDAWFRQQLLSFEH